MFSASDWKSIRGPVGGKFRALAGILMANTNTFYTDDGNEANYHSPNHQQAHSRFRRAVAVIVATLLCIVVSYCSIRSSTNTNLRNQHSRNLTWHENLEEGSGDYFDWDGVNSTWDIPPECQPFDCDEEDEICNLMTTTKKKKVHQ